MPTTDVTVIILHPEAGAAAGPLTRATAHARARLAERHAERFRRAGAGTVRTVSGPPDDVPFGRRLRALTRDLGPGGLVILGSGAVPLATASDLRRFVEGARGPDRRALANNRYSADILAIAQARQVLADVPDLPGDNELPRWLMETAQVPVEDLAGRWRLGVDVDGPLDLVLLGRRLREGTADLPPVLRGLVEERLQAVRAVASDPRAELLVAGRTSAAAVRWLEGHTTSRTRALIEERGLRTARPGQRPPRSVLGALLDRDGPASVGPHLADLADAAILDSRVLLAHRLGPDPAGWPSAEDRFASDLLLADRIRDPWLRDLTTAARDAPIPVLLGGHTLVGPGLRLALGPGPRHAGTRFG